jgi:hypothetical protein
MQSRRAASRRDRVIASFKTASCDRFRVGLTRVVDTVVERERIPSERAQANATPKRHFRVCPGSRRAIESVSRERTRLFFAKYFLLLCSNCAMLLKIFCVLSRKNLANDARQHGKLDFSSRSARRVTLGFAAGSYRRTNRLF